MSDKWPKRLPPLSGEQERIHREFITYWLEVLPAKYGFVEAYHRKFILENMVNRGRALEIGAGVGAQIPHLLAHSSEYAAVEIEPDRVEAIRRRFPGVQVHLGDCQEPLGFPSGYFDEVFAIHILEHLPRLPDALAEIRRVLKADGRLIAIIPCEGGLAYSLGRKLTTERIFKRKYKMDYGWLARSEHVNSPDEIVSELNAYFDILKAEYWPLGVKSINLNILIALVLKPKH